MKNNQNKKRFCSVLLAVFVVVMCMFSVYAFADNNEQTTAETSVSEQAKTDTDAVSASDDVAKTDEAASDETSEDIGEEEMEKPGLFGTPWSLLAPVIAIALALITKEVYSSLFIGIVAGALLSADFKPITAMDNMLNHGFIAAVSGTAGIFIFLVVLGILVALINKSGGSAAFGAWAERNIKTRIGAILATFVLGVLIFIDDYFNCLTVGSVMMPVTDRHKISRAKLSYLIDATAAPICMIAPISSWAAAVSSYAPEGQGLSLFIKAIPYNFYSLLTFVFIIAITFMKFDYGPMKLHEYNAINKGDLFTNGSNTAVTETEQPSQRGKVIDLVLPVVILIIVCVLSLIYVGGFFSGSSFVDAFANTDATVGLPWGGIVVLVLTIIYMVARRTVTFKEAMDCIPKGFIAMVPAILILTFATTLKNMTGLMGSDVFVKNFMANASSLNHFVPAIIFLVAIGISFATGTSWGTFGILIPIVIGIFPNGSELLIISMSACLAGSVCGDHCSPISDTTIMSSAGARCNHINHVSTQLPYAITVAVVSFVTYLIAGFVNSWYIVLPIGAILMIVTLFAIKAATSKKQA
ncbi:MAG: Na+/H+ antiporter NhaC family protein [Clostridia bacterium]|nr:Na+/H+ antiporter NhaC family protein [Clostridia bacterium]